MTKLSSQLIRSAQQAKIGGPIFSADAPYVGAATRALKLIEKGELSKVVLAARRQSPLQGELDLQATLLRLRATNPTSYVFAYGSQERVFLGATPELLVATQGQWLETEAVAGTAKRRDLLLRSKLQHEHQLVVDGVMVSLAQLGCTEIVVDKRRPHRAGELFHLRAGIRAKLAKDRDILDAAKALHPTPALGGLPRDKAMRFIKAEEGFRRGYYGGALGWLKPNGDGTLVVPIRSGWLTQGQITLFAGAGLVRGSNAEAESREIATKFETLAGALCFRNAP